MQSLTTHFGKVAIATVTALATSIGVLSQTASVSAQPAYGSYIGVGPAFTFTSDDLDNGNQVSAVLAVRYKLLKLPISLRTQAFLGSSPAVVPTVSYDFSLGWQTDLYLGMGAAFGSTNKNDSPSPLGDKVSFAIQPGVDYVIPNSDAVIFGNAVIAFDAYRNGGGTAISIQSGVGLKF